MFVSLRVCVGYIFSLYFCSHSDASLNLDGVARALNVLCVYVFACELLQLQFLFEPSIYMYNACCFCRWR